MSSTLLPLSRAARPPRRGRLGLTAAALALPIVLAGCGGENASADGEGAGDGEQKQVSDLGVAYESLLDSQSATFTMSLEDADGNLRAGLLDDASGEVPPEEVIDAVLGGSVSITVDPAGDATLRDLSTADPAASPEEQLRLANVAFSVDVDGGPLAQLRLVDGVVFAAVDFEKVDDVAVAAGEEPVSPMLDAFAAQSPELGGAVEDLRAGQFLQLDLAPFLGQLEGLTGQPTEPPAVDGQALAADLLAAVQPFSTVTGGEDGTFQVEVQARSALTAAAEAFSALPLPGVAEAFDPAALETLREGPLRATVSLDGESFSQMTLDLQSLADVAPEDPETPDLSGSALVIDVDDQADDLTAPDDVSDVDLTALLESFFGAFAGGMVS